MKDDKKIVFHEKKHHILHFLKKVGTEDFLFYLNLISFQYWVMNLIFSEFLELNITLILILYFFGFFLFIFFSFFLLFLLWLSLVFSSSCIHGLLVSFLLNF